MVKVGIVGVTGYTGIELLRLLYSHPHTEVTVAITDSYVNQGISNVYPHLTPHIDLIGEELNIQHIIDKCDLVFIALPEGHAKQIVPSLMKAGKKIIDLGYDYRDSATYGLPEYPQQRPLIASSQLVANPGCYPTASILSVLPALHADLIEIDSLIFDAKSGVSGAGRKLNLQNHFCEMMDNFVPYGVAGTHKHTPEIERILGQYCQQPVTIQFTPHVIPIIRGLSVTTYLKLKHAVSEEDVYQCYRDFYEHEKFIRLRRHIPQIKHVRGSHYCDISVHVDPRTKRLIVFSVIDNLLKGASGQAIQNMNVMYQLPEEMGLEHGPLLYP